MTTTTMRGMLCLLLGILLSSLVVAAPPRPMTDAQLDSVYAAGFNINVDMGIDLAASQPNSVFVTGGNTSNVINGLSITRGTSNTTGSNSGSIDPTGTYMPNLQNLVVNNINIAANALQNAKTLMNIFALQGDVAVGVNLNVVINPTNTTFSVSQTNINWGNVNLSSALPTLTTSTP